MKGRPGFAVIAGYGVLKAALVLFTGATDSYASWVIVVAVAAMLWIEEPRWRGERP